jgi:hypothetical protein
MFHSSHQSNQRPFPSPPTATKSFFTSHPTSTSSASPGRPSLVSKFDDTCDVVTFERDDSSEEELFSDDNDSDYGEAVNYDEPVGGVESNDGGLDNDASNESSGECLYVYEWFSLMVKAASLLSHHSTGHRNRIPSRAQPSSSIPAPDCPAAMVFSSPLSALPLLAPPHRASGTLHPSIPRSRPRRCSCTGVLMPTKQTGTHGTWNVMRRRFFRPAPRSLWTVVSFAPQNFPLSDVEQSVNRLKGACERLGEHLSPLRSQNLTSLLGMGKPATGLRLFSKLTSSSCRDLWWSSRICCWWSGSDPNTPFCRGFPQ